ncbi:MAG: 3-hydroxyacyl-CoA dehydrogenase/enoyl-CoA hydratase family protein, partial [Nitrospirae bacterium]
MREVAARMARPERVVGLHFFYHPVKNRLLEVIPWEGTSSTAAEAAERFAAILGKVALRCPDSPGFVVNRFFVPWLNEAVRLVEEGVADIPTVEATARDGLRLGMGPFELMNVTGVPIARHAAEGLAAELGPFYAPAPALVRQAEAGPWPLEGAGSPSGDVLDRLLAVVWVVGAELVAEGGATPLDVDLGARVGLRWRRGPFELWNRSAPEDRRRALAAFSRRYPEVPVPELLAAGGEVALPAVTAERRDGATVVWLARPDRSNALDGGVFEDLARCVAAAEGPLVLRGMGKNFAAGADIRFFLDAMEKRELGRIVAFTRRAQEVLAALEDHPHATVAAVDGFALGGGAELMLCCDVAVATPRARIGFPETGIGIYPGLGGCHRLVRRVGRGLARFLVGTGTVVGGEDAAAIGLVDACLPPEAHVPADLIAVEPAGERELPERWARIAELFAERSLE